MDTGKKKKGILKKVLIGLAVFIVLVIAIIVFTSATSKKLVCKSSQGNITVMYKDETITGYTVKGATFDQEKAQQKVDSIGMESYLSQFKTWFESATDGTCKYK